MGVPGSANTIVSTLTLWYTPAQNCSNASGLESYGTRMPFHPRTEFEAPVNPEECGDRGDSLMRFSWTSAHCSLTCRYTLLAARRPVLHGGTCWAGEGSVATGSSHNDLTLDEHNRLSTREALEDLYAMGSPAIIQSTRYGTLSPASRTAHHAPIRTTSPMCKAILGGGLQQHHGNLPSTHKTALGSVGFTSCRAAPYASVLATATHADFQPSLATTCTSHCRSKQRARRR
ncbi:hypothetical protein PSPO01_14619 [Paraphaeosphaeria sporulosa]